MLSNRRRIIIITVSVLIGTVFSALLIMSRNKKLTPNEWDTLAVNFFFALAIVFVIGIFLGRKPK
jgi:O-antigen/teichoic acid export membrane protein